MSELGGKVAIVTGAGSGMGRAAAQVFARHGAKVVAADISGAEQRTAAGIGDAALPFHCDVSEEAEVEALIAATIKTFGKVDAMLNVAGFALRSLLADADMANYDKMLDTDLRGVVHGTKHALRAMSKSGGVIINWASTAGFGASPGWAIYAAAKAGVIAITKGAAVEYGHLGIRTNVICPGPIYTEAMAAIPPERAAEMAENLPAGRVGQPEEVAELAAFLASDRAPFINGAVIAIDGGQSCQLR
jgi:NAD(P)-dependent dehydrogenase (short-subunit alcohol dehydrogenase family)